MAFGLNYLAATKTIWEAYVFQMIYFFQLSQYKESSSHFEARIAAKQEELDNFQQLLQDKNASFQQQMLAEAERMDQIKVISMVNVQLLIQYISF